MNQLERELFQHATGMSGLHGDDDGQLDGLFSKIFKMAGPILPIAGAALAPFTGGASLIAAGALTAVGNAATGGGQPQPQAAPQPQPSALVQQPLANQTSPVYAPAQGMDQKTLLLIGGALVLVLLLTRK